MNTLRWDDDEVTAFWAKRWTIPLPIEVQPQYDGGNKRWNERTWVKRIRQQQFPIYCYHPGHSSLLASPTNIIECFQEAKVLEALALTVAWGSMTRTTRRIYTKPNEVIEQILQKCRQLIRRHHSVQDAWNTLVTNLQWGDVITSKVLHFLSRSLGYEYNPPVPIDGKIIIEQVWPAFQAAIKSQRQISELAPLEAWRDKNVSWQAYNRYMTAVRCWSHTKGWTTTELENTLFKAYYPRK